MKEKAYQLKNYRKSILEFIDYLHKNRSYMKDDVRTIEKIRGIGGKQHRLKPKESYKDARKFNELQTEMESELNSLTWNNLIIEKAKELKLYENSTLDIRNRLDTTMHLMDDIKPAEATEIIKAKEKYLTFRKETDFCSFLIGFLFMDLDRALTPFFGAFTDVSDMKRTQSEPPTPQSEDDPVETIINNFNGDSVDDIIDHFRSLEKLMNNGEFMQWIKLAFEKQEPPERKFKLIGKYKKGDIRKLFHTYWRSSGKHGNREVYVRLLSDYFEKFEFENTKANFHK
jgi:hypothetical protein